MNEAVIKEEVVEEEFNFTFKNGEYVEINQEEIEQKPEYLLEKDIKTETNDDSFENNNSDGFFEDVEEKPEEKEFNIEKVSREVGTFQCEICQKTMPRGLLKMITLEEDKTVLSEIFKPERSLEKRVFYVCVSHIQKTIEENDGKLKFASTPSEKRLRSFIRTNKKSIKIRTSRRGVCHVCNMSKPCSEFYTTKSKSIRMVIMVGCVLRGTHSIEQAKSCLSYQTGFTCYSHCKELIDVILIHLEVRYIQELLKCSELAFDNLMNIGKNIDSNFTADQFTNAFKELFLKNQKFKCNL
ncbi:hypothetical protein B9Z55_021152 [Caenorhabditis nigoni]|uniref:Lin-15A/B-like domain-containing protein n=1 Tax=Caenorhabditis nigoni TaxID=1611254 RepID=A0A2G5TQP0_9PELO|nr:hypothetical protein B9Z55_021152 [Caenorhabditis nigoni]